MPRLAPSLFRRAGSISPHLATLLPACRTIVSAQTELRWIRRHVLDITYPPSGSQHYNHDNNDREKRTVCRPKRENPPPRRRRGIRIRAGQQCLMTTTPSAGGSKNGRGKRSMARDDETEDLLARLVARRGAGEPLQYVLGTQPFGDLEMLCAKGVLIPRPETEAWASMLADLVFPPPSRTNQLEREIDRAREEGLRILDLCCGTGCVGLSLYARGMAARGRENKEGGISRACRSLARVFGFDVEPRAVRLARRNLRHNFRSSRNYGSVDSNRINKEVVEGAVAFRQADIFTDEWMAYLDEEPKTAPHEDRRARERRVDVLVSNPPYISQRGFRVDTARSVRNYEPKLALVPAGVSLCTPSTPQAPARSSITPQTCAPEDIFYARLLEIADELCSRIAAFEVGDTAQAIRVAEMAIARFQAPHHLAPEVGEGNRDRLGAHAVARWDVVEIWRDWPDCRPSDGEEDVVLVRGREVPVRGSGHGRVVFLAQGQMARNRFVNRGFRREVYASS
ncbi:S-adenosyl-L-methionine-dependent methyltransferase [Xylaria venustula]|nr:S-adenosyl-L-methionine-dependent methyltransferase [Xylaria venustula]